ncbi:T9SS type A sorting domain-containing protein [Paracrocinitomix mangrovi]|uniref:M43 family zinc metalloprotease n=1 Tax=Paracrocinitomix mangrovi TaxID=2862509 RepID=UPI001C8D40AE|nr:M43 family zinc metalloprotease [Paracrocinitomix mangrovi]UKN03103.1 T9SS type A sorting domain-containing protein [Paracrocinitomix mangrovi]
MKKYYLSLVSLLTLNLVIGQTTQVTNNINSKQVNGNSTQTVPANLNSNGHSNIIQGVTAKSTTVNGNIVTYTVDQNDKIVDGHEFHNCKSHELTKAMYESMGVYDQFYQDYLNGAQQAQYYTPNQYKTPGTNTIAVIFHVVHEGEPVGTGTNVSNAAIMAVFNDLVEDFSLTNADQSQARTGFGFNPANPGINFCLATQDPLGNPLSETGVIRVSTTETWFDPDDPNEVNAMKGAALGSAIWDRDDYLNVWICDISNGASSGTAGYAYKPSTSFLPNANIDGIVIDYNLGVNNDNVLTHEVGHYLGLDHTWGGSGGCGQDDGFTDTPNTTGPSFNYSGSCSGSQQTCTVETQYENYMDYSNCTVMFTTEQSNFMNTILSGIRSSLLLSPGCDPAGPPVCAFTSSPAGPGPIVISQNGAVVFTDASNASPTSWTWTISGTPGVDWAYTGGTSAASQNPEVTFYNVGTYDVTLVASNGFGSCTGVTETGYVQVVAPAAGTACDTLRNYALSENLTAYLNGGSWGYLPGHGEIFAGFPIDEYAEPYTALATAEVRRLYVPVLAADNVSGTGTVNFYVRADNAGSPGAVLATETVSIANLNAGFYNTIEFTTPASVTGAFWVGAELFYGASQDTVIFAMADLAGRPAGIGTTMMREGAIWYNTTDYYGAGGINMSVAWDVLLSNGPAPVADMSFSEAAVCPGGDIIVNGSASQNTTSYEWYQTDDPFTTIINSSTSAGTTFNFAGPAGSYGIYLFADGSCMTDGLLLPVTVYNAVTGTANVTHTTCGDNNGAVTISGASGGDGTYTYSLDGVNYGASNTFSNLPAGSYTAYILSNGDACEAQIPFTINSSTPLSGTATSAIGICPGGTATLTATGGTTYTWYDGATVIGSTATINVSPSVTTQYSVEISNGVCTDIQYSIVTVNPNPTVNAGTDQTVCAGTMVTLSGSGASSYTWDNGVTDGVAFAASATTTYTVTGTDGNGCTGTDQVIVNVNALPPVSAGTDQSVCNGGSVTLSGSGATSYSWNNGVTDGISFTPATTLTYTVTGTDGNGCVNTDQVVVTVNSNPTVNAGTDQTVCAGTMVTLSGSGATSYSWDNGVTDGVPFAATATTTYTVTGTDGNGCTGTDQVVVTVNPLPTVNAGTDQTVCAGTMVTLSGSGASSYAWDNGVTDGVAFAATATTTYTVTGTDVNGCVNTDQVVVTVNPLPTVNAGTDQTVCAGTSVTLTGSGTASSYAWDNGVTDGVAFTPASTTTYTVTGTDGNGCTNTDQVIVTVNSLPVVNAGTDQTVCEGDMVTLTATGATSYSWDNGVTNGVPFAATTTTIYTVIGTNGSGCTDTDQVIVNVNSLPTVNGGVDQSVCAGNTVTLTGTGSATTYTWDNGVTDNVPFTPATTTTYTVTGVDVNGCVNTNQTIVTVNSNPSAINLTETCNGGNVDYTVVFDISGGASPYTVSGFTGTVVGSTWTSDPIPSGNSYNLTITDANGCTSTPISGVKTCACISNAGTMVTSPTLTMCGSGSLTATHNGNETLDGDDAIQYYIHTNAGSSLGTQFGSSSTPTFTFGGGMVFGTTYYISAVVGNDLGGGVVDLADPCLSVSAGTPVVWYNIPTVGAGTDQTVCQGDMVTLSGTGASTYSWDNGVTNATPFAATVTTTYTVTGTDGNGCSNTDAVVVTVNSLPTVNAGTDQTVCAGTTVTLTGSGTASTYTWDNGVTNASPFTPTATNTYTVTGTNVNGCTNTDAVIVTVNALPTVSGGPDQTVCNGNPATLTGTGTASTYTWDNGVIDGNPFLPTGTNTYTVTGLDVNGCTNTDQVVITVNANPTVNAGTDQTVCQGTPVVLSGSGAASYSWDNGVSNGVAFTPSATLTYTVVGTDVNGCTGTDQVTVNVNAAPPVSAGPDQSICFGNTVTLSGSGALTYSWNFGVVNGSPFSPGITSTYTVTGTDGNGCTATDQVVVTVNSNPSINAGADQTICEGTATSVNGSGGVSYVWDNGVSNGVPFTPTATATYTVTGTDGNGCSSTDQMVININPLPAVDAGADQVVCTGGSVTLSGAGAASYTWNNGVTNGVSFVPTGTMDYVVTGTDVNGCVNTDTVNVSIGLATVDAGTDLSVCEGTAVTLNGSGAVTYVWNNGITNGVPFAATTTQYYTVTGTDSNGCTGEDSVLVTVNSAPMINAGPDLLVCLGDAVTLTATGADTYSWNNGVTNGVPFTPTGTGVYTVTGTDVNGCLGTDQVIITTTTGANITSSVTHDSGTSNGAINITITGGQTPYTVSWSNSATTEDINNLAFGDYIVTVTDGNGCVTVDTITVLNVVGVEENVNDELYIYPNPSNAVFNIELDGNYLMEITDARGRLIISRTENDDTVIDLSDYEDGVYFLRVYKDGQTAVRRLLKQ